MNTNLRILIDEDVEDPLADAIEKIAAFNVECVRDLPMVRGKSDQEVMQYAISSNRIVLTLDRGFTKANYPICTHPGIIRIDSRCKHFTILSDVIRRYSQSGHRSKSKHAITHLAQDRCHIEGADQSVWEVPY